MILKISFFRAELKIKEEKILKHSRNNNRVFKKGISKLMGKKSQFYFR